ncbi:hypothetical protein BKA70DRAFT_772091 [Coprinopsis sp. MPI-PUGE-AT-0042]|nr:hypothetical protein BKA70DRAFT_772091 [Coprinopsis sp. MPI-PUGE-AT-0042]
MSTTSLPSYRPASSLHGTPVYSYEPRDHERRLAMGARRMAEPTGTFVKQSRNRNASLHLAARGDNPTLPTYSSGSYVKGFVQLSKNDGITGVEVKLEGSLKLREIAEGGHSTVRLCFSTKTLWTRQREGQMCPEMLDFSLPFPETFVHDGVTYPLPPTFDIKLSGLPGFTANIDYSVSALISDVTGPALKTKAIGLLAGTSNVSTPILYNPRTQPPSPLPPSLLTDSTGFVPTDDWTCVESSIAAKGKGAQDIKTKLYIPASKTFSVVESIPFHLLLSSTPASLATFLPLSPALNTLGRPKALRLQVMRQSTVDVRNVIGSSRAAGREMWRIDCVGEASFKLTADAPSWIAYSGQIPLNENIKTSGFRAAGLSVKDCLLLTLNPPDLARCPFGDLRQVVGVRLTTDACAGGARPPSAYSNSA